MARGLPLYVQLETTIRQRIRSGEYQSGHALPTEQQLMDEFRVSRGTVRLALDGLNRDGLIARYPGRGTFATDISDRLRVLTFRGSLERLIALGDGAETEFTVTGVAPARPDPNEATELKLAAERLVTRVVGFKRRGEERVAHLVISVPETLGASLGLREGEVYPAIISLLMERLGQRVREARQVITVGQASPPVAGALRIGVGAPLLIIKRTYFSPEGAPVEFAVSSYPGDRYQYEILISSHE